jgi:acetyltransferase-like isoleucine patch superfamily enzyme
MKLELLYLFIRAIPKTIYFNLHYFKLKDALKFPAVVSHLVYLKQMKGTVLINTQLKFGMIKIGFGDVGIFDRYKLRTIWEVSGCVIFHGSALFNHGARISIHGDLIWGSNFNISSAVAIVCFKSIVFGDDIFIAWDTLIMDTDFHKIISNETIVNNPREIVIGSHVLIGCRCFIMKGTILADNSIVAANSVVNKEYLDENCIIGGAPAKVLKTDVKWEL